MAKFLNTRLPTVFVAIPTAGKDGQQRLEGVLRYLRLGFVRWNLKLVISQATIPVEQIERLAREGTDAFLLHLPYNSTDIERLKQIGKPIVITTATHRPRAGLKTLKFVLLDNADLGTVAADHLMSLGRFASYGFIPSAYETNWSRERGAAFRKRLKACGLSCSTYAGRGDAANRTHDQTDLVHWIDSLRTPAAVFAANDNYALQALLACDAAGLEVPGQVALLGVDNDELIVNNFSPALSSIEPDFTANGFEAARTLDRMLERSKTASPGGRQNQRQSAAKPRLFIRESTAFLTPAAKLVEDALASISKLALTGATPSAIARSLGVSRCLLDLRLRQAHKETVGTLLRNRRLEEVRRLLRSTTLSTEAIATRCAFPNVNHLRNLFKKTYGVSMHAWRTGGLKVSQVAGSYW